MTQRKTSARKILGAIAAAGSIAVSVHVAMAQEIVADPPEDTFVFVSNMAAVAPFAGPVDILGGIGAVPGAVVTGKPYSAEAVTESTQILADGNRITQRNEMRIYRDGQGRTRREQTLGGLGVWQAANEPTTTVTIHDPVAGAIYMLDSRTETVHAIRPSRLHSAYAIATGGAVAVASDGDNVAVVHGEARHAGPEASQVGTFEVPVPPPMPGSPGTAGIRVFSSRTPAGAISAVAPFAAGEVITEDLGEQILQGVLARGTRETRTIPAGAIGNERPIDMVTERWYSDEIEAEVQRRTIDPRFGETTYRLVNVVLGEPSPDLFVVPDSYELQTEENRFEFKLQGPGPGTAAAPR
ncbi:MAG TPA: hypothetical protein VIC71_01675 [Gammaproteobacteria bacterium]|jgi:hypothetical protein